MTACGAALWVQGPKHRAIFHCFARYISRKLVPRGHAWWLSGWLSPLRLRACASPRCLDSQVPSASSTQVDKCAVWQAWAQAPGEAAEQAPELCPCGMSIPEVSTWLSVPGGSGETKGSGAGACSVEGTRGQERNAASTHQGPETPQLFLCGEPQGGRRRGGTWDSWYP